MISARANPQEDTVTEVTGTATAEESSVVYLEDTPMGIALEFIAVVLVLLIVFTSTLLGCLVYPIVWLCTRKGEPSSSAPQQRMAKEVRGVAGYDNVPRAATLRPQSLAPLRKRERRA